MAKKQSVNFTYTDGKKLTRNHPSGIFEVRAPLTLRVVSDGTARIDAGVRCSTHCLLTVEPLSLKTEGLQLVGKTTFSVGEPIVIEIKNSLLHDVTICEGDVLMRVHPLDSNHLEVA